MSRPQTPSPNRPDAGRHGAHRLHAIALASALVAAGASGLAVWHGRGHARPAFHALARAARRAAPQATPTVTERPPAAADRAPAGTRRGAATQAAAVPRPDQALPGDWSIPPAYRASFLGSRVRHFPEKLLALTFDDGPDPEVTPRVLAALAARGARATFFVHGNRAARHPELLRAIAAGGHAIGNHGFSHPVRCSRAQARQEIDRTQEIILAATGRRTTLFRPPFGIRQGSLARQAQAEGYTVLLWTISSADSRPIGPEVIANNIIHTPNPGDIAIMHDGPGHVDTADALPRVLDELGKAGFRFVTLPELMRAWSAWKPATQHASR